MHKHEIPELSQRLSQLADALSGRAPSPAGLMVWADALDSVDFDDVRAALTDWPKRNVKMPAPSDIRKSAMERVSTRIEETSRRNNASPGFDPEGWNPTSEVGRRELAKMRDILSDSSPGLVAGSFHHIGGRPNADHKEWARVLRVKHESGESLSLTQIAAYKGALGIE